MSILLFKTINLPLINIAFVTKDQRKNRFFDQTRLTMQQLATFECFIIGAIGYYAVIYSLLYIARPLLQVGEILIHRIIG